MFISQTQPLLPLDPSYDHEVDVHLCTGPGYHSAPLYADIRKPLSNGIATVLLDKWNTEQALASIEQYRVTRSHFVPIMFQRLLALPEAVRQGVDTSSLERVIHGAAPCSPEVKRAMINWLGPVLYEYYAGSEGVCGLLCKLRGLAQKAWDCRTVSQSGGDKDPR